MSPEKVFGELTIFYMSIQKMVIKDRENQLE